MSEEQVFVEQTLQQNLFKIQDSTEPLSKIKSYLSKIRFQMLMREEADLKLPMELQREEVNLNIEGLQTLVELDQNKEGEIFI